uniref:Uncharacterized protein n=1 Tax=Thalassiosira rotula TaxID=49265 RepID=A0A8B0SA98_9STRA|nr:hypothetical protein LK200_mgp10 [Thalassiosira rotula]QTX08923.1 hypothetical protein [Thalassiosira rotula]
MKTNQLIKHISIRVTRIILLLLAVQRLLTLSFSFIFVHFNRNSFEEYIESQWIQKEDLLKKDWDKSSDDYLCNMTLNKQSCLYILLKPYQVLLSLVTFFIRKPKKYFFI